MDLGAGGDVAGDGDWDGGGVEEEVGEVGLGEVVGVVGVVHGGCVVTWVTLLTGLTGLGEFAHFGVGSHGPVGVDGFPVGAGLFKGYGFAIAQELLVGVVVADFGFLGAFHGVRR